MVVMMAHRFATGLPCRASSQADSAMLASLRVAVGWGCGSRPFGRASLARARPERPDMMSASRKSRDLVSSAQSQTLAPATAPISLSPTPPRKDVENRAHKTERDEIAAVAGAAMQFTRRDQSPVLPPLSSGHPRCSYSLSGLPIVANPRLRASRRGDDRVADSLIRMVADAPCESGLLRGPHHSPPQGLDSRGAGICRAGDVPRGANDNRNQWRKQWRTN